MQCDWCDKWGKTELASGEDGSQIPALIGIDGLGLLCEGCLELGEQVDEVFGFCVIFPSEVWTNIAAFLGT